MRVLHLHGLPGDEPPLRLDGTKQEITATVFNPLPGTYVDVEVRSDSMGAVAGKASLDVPRLGLQQRRAGVEKPCSDPPAFVHPKVVQERLGHASVSIALDIHSHCTANMQQEAAEKVEEALAAALAGA